jgi:hypothetical protein
MGGPFLKKLTFVSYSVGRFGDERLSHQIKRGEPTMKKLLTSALIVLALAAGATLSVVLLPTPPAYACSNAE